MTRPWIVDAHAGARLLRASRPLSRSLARQMLDIVGRQAPYRLAALVVPDEEAPNTYPDLLDAVLRATADHPGYGTVVPVSDDGGVSTAWGHPALNYLFRAWHDWTHVQLGAGFDRPGEQRTARAQLALVDGPLAQRVLWADSEGQQCFYYAHGRFPTDQRRFVLRALALGVERAVELGGCDGQEGGTD